MTPYHAKYYAYELTREGGEGVDRLGRALFDATVDLNPHQIEAALFALRSPLSKGVLLADEVGLGKTVEAGLVLCQHWAERRRRLLVICPASLRKQWGLELTEKFNLPSVILDAKSSREFTKVGIANPFNHKSVVITSLHYAAANGEFIRAVDWHLVVIDEAHKLRDAHRDSNRIGQAIRTATEGKRKILLSATPLQNSLTELYGLSTLIDPNLFGDLPSFRTQYMNTGGDLVGLRARLRSFSWRTLRKDVLEFVRYTERRLITRPFAPTEQEHKLYEAVSAFLQRPDNYALPARQRHLLVLLVRKVLASSPQAVAGTLEIMRERLMRLREEAQKDNTAIQQLIAGEDLDPDLVEEILEDAGEIEPAIIQEEPPTKTAPAIDLPRLDREIQELDDYIRWARGTGVDTKTRALLVALDIGFKQMAGMAPPAPRKAVVFTESRRTQAYLRDFLEANGYAGKVVTFNGTNSDPQSAIIYQQWLVENRHSGRATGSRPVDMRTALIDRFRDGAEILIATEAAAEGINLQFCAMVVNHDLPWNPQRIEQRIGRCHRYGQKHDVVVINFLNERNAADRRVYQLLEQKFNLFSGVFGASDDVLGTVESGVDFERRVLEIVQQCRSQAEIEAGFDALKKELEVSIQARITQTRSSLLEHFDEDVHSRLKLNLTSTRDQLDRMGRMFWALTRHELTESASFDDDTLSFELRQPPVSSVEPGRYHLIAKDREEVPSVFLYRLNHPLGEHVLATARDRVCPPASLVFDATRHPVKISVVQALVGRSGWLCLEHLRVDSFESEDYLLFSAFDDSGTNLDQETCQKLFHLAATATPGEEPSPDTLTRLAADADRHVRSTLNHSLEQNNRHFREAREQLEKWAEDKVVAAEKALKATKDQIKGVQTQANQAATMAEQHAIQEKLRDLQKTLRAQRQNIFAVEDEALEKRDALIASLEARMVQKSQISRLFTIRWQVN